MKKSTSLCAAAFISLALHAAAWGHGTAAHPSAATASAPHAEPESAPAPAVQTDWGMAGRASAAQRTITLRLSDDMRFRPDRITLREGETVKFVIRNSGRVMHEFVLGTQAEIDAHAVRMKQHPDMAHDSPYMAHVAPGQRQTLVWTFNRSGEFVFACLLPGHYEAGMSGRVRVQPATRAPHTPRTP